MNDTAAALARDIQQNVGTLFEHPADQQALAALHLDAQQLQGSAKSEGASPGADPSLKDGVVKELARLEKDGVLPAVTIDDSGQIEASKLMPTPSGSGAGGESGHKASVRDIIADPGEDTQVRDLAMAAKTTVSLDQLIARQQSK